MFKGKYTREDKRLPIHCLDELELKQYENIIIAPENWKSEIRNCTLYRYEFNTKNFNVIDKIAGYYISEEIEIPIDIVSINNCKKEIEKTNTKLILLTEESMMKIKSDVMENTNKFSIIRWSNMKK